MSQLISSVRWVGISQASKILFQLASMAILARLLPPSDYGVMAMASVVTTLAGMLREMGTGTAIIQKQELTPEVMSTVFWLNMAMGTVLGLVLWLTSPLIAIFFKEPQLVGVLTLMAIIFPISSSTTVHQALLERSSKFKVLTIMDLMTQAAGLGVAIIAALNGAGVYSFVIPAIVTSLISSVWLWSHSGWNPRLLWSTHEFKVLLHFTGNLTAFNFVNYFSRNADSMVIGRMLGSVALGTYSMAYKLMLFPVQNLTWVVNRVLLPTLSRLQNNKDEAKTLYLKSLNMIVTLTAPMMVGLWVLREPFVAVAFGPKWTAVVAILAWLAPVGLIQSAVSTTGTVFTAYGKTNLMFKLGLLGTVINVTSFLIGAQYGLVELAFFYFVGNFLNAIVCSHFTVKTLSSSLKELINTIKAPILSASMMGLITYPLTLIMISKGYPSILTVALISITGALIYFLLLIKVFNQSLDNMIKLLWKSKTS
ncbi:MOP flippase family protein [Methylovorus sp. MP688]|uniref:MOP flippase family protein n=1 Tax=Methylovorus sp. (strain MP688) TaxID=887061 RepID=UPI0001EC4881|nr:MOP flippase family protein [Methylovorus sp. MP688]ADQ84969.1 polysaccharide biosynthesis protein [Methylovorus sp. MP688]